jgi:hypothetical protein
MAKNNKKSKRAKNRGIAFKKLEVHPVRTVAGSVVKNSNSKRSKRAKNRNVSKKHKLSSITQSVMSEKALQDDTSVFVLYTSAEGKTFCSVFMSSDREAYAKELIHHHSGLPHGNKFKQILILQGSKLLCDQVKAALQNAFNYVGQKWMPVRRIEEFQNTIQRYSQNASPKREPPRNSMILRVGDCSGSVPEIKKQLVKIPGIGSFKNDMWFTGDWLCKVLRGETLDWISAFGMFIDLAWCASKLI